MTNRAGLAERIELLRRFLNRCVPQWQAASTAKARSAEFGRCPLISWDELAELARQLRHPGSLVSPDQMTDLVDAGLQAVVIDSLVSWDASPSKAQAESFLLHLQRRLSKLQFEDVPAGKTTIALLASGYNLAVLVNKSSSTESGSQKDRRAEAGRFFESIGELPDRFRESTSARLALWMLERLIDGGLCSDSGRTQVDSGKQPKFDAPERKLLEALVNLAGGKAKGLPIIMRNCQVSGTEETAGLWEYVKEKTHRLSMWLSSTLVQGSCHHAEAVEKWHFTESGQAERYLKKWSNVESAAGEISHAFPAALTARFQSYADKLFELSLVPQPEGTSGVLEASRFMIPNDLPAIPATSRALRVFARLLYHAVLPLCGDSSTPNENLDGEIRRDIRQLQSMSAEPGDIHVLSLLLTRIKERVCQRGGSSWSHALQGIPPQNREAITELISLCPPAWLLEPRLLPTPLQGSARQQVFRRFLTADSLRTLRIQVADALATKIDAGDDGREDVDAAFTSCMSVDGEHGGILVLESVFKFVERLIRPFQAANADSDPVGGETISRPPGENHEAFRQKIGAWFTPGPRRSWLIAVFLRLIEVRTSLSGFCHRENIDHCRGLWVRLSVLATSGLRDRPWPDNARQNLQRFWFDLGSLACRDRGFAPQLFETGDPDFDQPDQFLCRLFAQLVRDEIAPLRISDPVRTGNPQISIKKLGTWLQDFLQEDSSIQRLLMVHQYLVRGNPPFIFELNPHVLFPTATLLPSGPCFTYA